MATVVKIVEPFEEFPAVVCRDMLAALVEGAVVLAVAFGLVVVVVIVVAVVVVVVVDVVVLGMGTDASAGCP